MSSVWLNNWHLYRQNYNNIKYEQISCLVNKQAWQVNVTKIKGGRKKDNIFVLRTLTVYSYEYEKKVMICLKQSILVGDNKYCRQETNLIGSYSIDTNIEDWEDW